MSDEWNNIDTSEWSADMLAALENLKNPPIAKLLAERREDALAAFNDAGHPITKQAVSMYAVRRRDIHEVYLWMLVELGLEDADILPEGYPQ